MTNDPDYESTRKRYIPEIIEGDMDSIRPEVKQFYSSQGSKISDKSHNQETTDLHKCISRIHRCTPDHEKTNVSSRLPFKLGTFVIAISDLFMSYNVKTQYLLKFQIYRLLL
jgi:thiamine pyrophosphokinase